MSTNRSHFFTIRSDAVATRVSIGNGLAIAIASAIITTLVAPTAPLSAQAQRRPATVTPASDPALARLESELTRLTTIAGGKVGVAAIHLETGREVVLNRGEPFPMASTFKVPIAVQLLTRVDSGLLQLDNMIAIRPSDLHPGSGTLTQLFDDPGVTLSVRNLLELMLLISDNSATDIMLRTAGGSAPVNARLKALDIAGISVDRSTLHLIADAIGVKNLPPDAEITPQVFRDLSRGVSSNAQKSAANAFYRDRRDTSTPDGMARLLETIWRGRALSQGQHGFAARHHAALRDRAWPHQRIPSARRGRPAQDGDAWHRSRERRRDYRPA